ncbi:MAG: DUF2924 domain-containing protein [Planctomycetia bacterium]|nr:DUF2924 domain-containing protein [Planctomycetia bacterium]
MTKSETTAKKKAPKATPRVRTKPAPKSPKKAPPADGLTRAEIDRANAAGPGAVDALLRGAAKGGKAKTPAKGKTPTPAPTPATPAKDGSPRPRDPRLPKTGTVLTRVFNGKEIRVEVLDAGFKFDGETWRSLSAIARKVSGTSWNGFLFFNLLSRAATPAPMPTETK